MKGVGEEILDFEIVGIKPRFNNHEENGVSIFPDERPATGCRNRGNRLLVGKLLHPQ